MTNIGRPIIIVTLILWIVILVSIPFVKETPEKQIVDCYDEFHNKIIGLDCETTNRGMPDWWQILLGLNCVATLFGFVIAGVEKGI